MMRIECLWRTLPLLLAVTFVGCDPAGPPTSTVSGTVKLNGREVPGGMVTFHGAESRVATALIQPDGTYIANAVAPGANKVTVTGVGGAGPDAPKDPTGGKSVGSVTIPAKYADANQS